METANKTNAEIAAYNLKLAMLILAQQLKGKR